MERLAETERKSLPARINLNRLLWPPLLLALALLQSHRNNDTQNAQTAIEPTPIVEPLPEKITISESHVIHPDEILFAPPPPEESDPEPAAFAIETELTQKPENPPIIAAKIKISQIGLDEEIQLAPYDPKENTFVVPPKGVATDTSLSTDIVNSPPLKNSIYIFGHSKFDGQKQAFYDLYRLDIGDKIEIEDVFGQVYKFTVQKIILANLDNAYDHVSPLESKEKTMLILQTSVKTSYDPLRNWSGRWILPKEDVLEKADIKTDLNENNYLLLFIVATLENEGAPLRVSQNPP